MEPVATTSYFGTGADDRISGGTGNPFQDQAGEGNDILIGASGGDAYKFDQHSGNDIVIDAGNSSGDINTVQIRCRDKPSSDDSDE